MLETLLKGVLMSNVNHVVEYIKSNHDRHLSELIEFAAIPSISTLPAHKQDMLRAAEWVAAQMRGVGLDNVDIIPTGGHPVVYGEWLGVPGKPTVLIYGHYDVQPVDPLNEWITPPFEPTVRGDEIFARGVSDMKGQVQAFLKALEAWTRQGGLPVNVRVMVEGEEELGSPNLAAFVAQHKEKLKCDMVLNADSMNERPDLPALVYGLRGLAYFEIWVHGPAHDVHSGLFGGSILNPAQALCELIAGMHDENGRVTLPGFYDKVRVLSEQERAELARLPQSDDEWREMTGVRELYGEKGFTTVERLGARPTLEVNGLLSGFVGEGVKTVLPAKAMAKISMRLVPHQDPLEVERQLRAYLERHAPPAVSWELKCTSTAAPALVDRNSPGMRAAAAALEAAFGARPIYKLMGGTVPVVSILQTQLGVDSIQMGFSLPNDNFHGPNEKMYLPNLYRGIEAYALFFDAVSELGA